MIVPKHLQIETINGICTAKCSMCTIKKWSRKRLIMSDETFEKILKKFHPYKEKIDFLSLFFCGEPLLDKTICNKIKIAKELEFSGIGFSTNATELKKEISENIIKAGLDTIIFSIDGIDKQTHENIRVDTNFDCVVTNVKNFIKIRNEINGNTRIIIRFIRQESNKEQWPTFLKNWALLLNKDIGDDILKFDVHNWGGELEEYDKKDSNKKLLEKELICHDIFEKMVIYTNGNVGLCCIDANGFYDIGNVIDNDPIEIYNSQIFKHHRNLMKEGKISELEHCRNCTIPRSKSLKDK